MPPSVKTMNQQDRDVLIEIRTKVEILQSTVASMENNFSARLNRVEKEKVNYTDLNLIKETIAQNLGITNKATDRLENLKETKEVVENLASVVNTQGQNVDWVKSKMLMFIGVLVFLQFLGVGIILVALKAFLK